MPKEFKQYDATYRIQDGEGDLFEFYEVWKNPATNRDSKHVYLLNGKPLRGITSILKVIAKENLIQWAADVAVGELGWKDIRKCSKEECDLYAENMFKQVVEVGATGYFSMLDLARTKHLKMRDSGADLGTVTHKMVEIYAGLKINEQSLREITVLEALNQLKMDDKKVVTLTEQEAKDVLEMYQSFFNWAETENVEFIASEKLMYSKKYWIAGTCDLLIRWKGKLLVGDVKTMDKIWDRTPFFQANGGYRIMLEENGVTGIEGAAIIRIAKPEKVRASQNSRYPITPFEVLTSFDGESDRKGFLAALTLTDMLNTYQK